MTRDPRPIRAPLVTFSVFVRSLLIVLVRFPC